MQPNYSEIFKILDEHKCVVEKKIHDELLTFGADTKLKEACAYALLNGGKRFRPVIVLLCAKAIGKNCDVSDAALAVEFFHTASLIADDFPCMDNDDLRRNKPSLHKAFGEATALLASYALISAGYRSIYKNAVIMKEGAEKAFLLAIENATQNTGILGATGGQFLDLYPPNQDVDTLKEILNKKTVTLFEVAFVLGWIFGGGDLKKISIVKQVAYHWGMAFQIADDLDDIAQDNTQEREVNLASVIGLKPATKLFHEEIFLLKAKMKELSLDTKDFLAMVSALEQSFPRAMP
ncbi:MAG: polyprenyl synthetase family protein [Chlamydiales bacterium]|nr:polyprenyl synthetase family protein [Chlamydiales bacterium]